MRWSASLKRPARAFGSPSNVRPLVKGRPIFEKSVMSMMLIALLVVLLPPLQTGATRAVSTMQPDVDRLVRAAEKLAGTWPSQAPPPIPEVAIVARHGKAVVPLLMLLLSDDPNAEDDRKRWKVQQQLALTLSHIYSESQHCGRTYCDGDPRERIGRVREGWLSVIASDTELQALSARELLDRFKQEKVFWRQFEIGQVLTAANVRSAVTALEAWLTHDDRHLRGNVTFLVGRLGDSRGFDTIAEILADRSQRSPGPRERLCKGSGDEVPDQDWTAGYGDRTQLNRFF